MLPDPARLEPPVGLAAAGFDDVLVAVVEVFERLDPEAVFAPERGRVLVATPAG